MNGAFFGAKASDSLFIGAMLGIFGPPKCASDGSELGCNSVVEVVAQLLAGKAAT